MLIKISSKLDVVKNPFRLANLFVFREEKCQIEILFDKVNLYRVKIKDKGLIPERKNGSLVV